ncbi:MAG: TolC family protein [Chloracidobacterium sp.]|nr:TolC family protein [Chloracidobacterium sp.]
MKSRLQLSKTLVVNAVMILFLASAASFAQTDQVVKARFGPAAAPPVKAPGPEKPDSSAGSSRSGSLLFRVGIRSAATVPLTLDEAIRRALANNNSIEIARDDVRFQETQIRALLGFYDPVFNITPNFNLNNTTGSSATRDFSVNSNMTNFIRPGGGNYQVFFNNSRTENQFAQAQVTSGSISGVGTSAVYSSTYGIRFTQPLFRNFGIDSTRRNLRIARRQLEQTDADFRRQTIDIISQVQRTYWDLVFALRTSKTDRRI